jgi:hypothetical protein
LGSNKRHFAAKLLNVAYSEPSFNEWLQNAYGADGKKP